MIIVKCSIGGSQKCSIGGSQVSAQLKFSNGEVIMMSAQAKDNNSSSYMASLIAQHAGKAKLYVFNI